MNPQELDRTEDSDHDYSLSQHHVSCVELGTYFYEHECARIVDRGISPCSEPLKPKVLYSIGKVSHVQLPSIDLCSDVQDSVTTPGSDAHMDIRANGMLTFVRWTPCHHLVKLLLALACAVGVRGYTLKPQLIHSGWPPFSVRKGEYQA